MTTLNFKSVFAAASALLFLAFPSWGQGWEKTYGSNRNDAFSDVLATADGGYIAVGTQQDGSSDDRNVFLLKTDADGLTEWTKTLGYPTESEVAKNIQPTSDGGYIIGGTRLGSEGYFGLLIKTDAFGNESWMQVTESDSVEGRWVIEMANGGFALVGAIDTLVGNSLDKNVFLSKFHADGTPDGEGWRYGGAAFDEGYGVQEIPGEGLLLAGLTQSFGAGHYDVYAIRTDYQGDTVWTKTYGTAQPELGFALTSTVDGKFVIVGQTENAMPGSEDAFLLKIQADGTQDWFHVCYKAGSQTPRSVRLAGENGYIIAGNTTEAGSTERNALLIKMDGMGGEVWTKNFGGVLGDGLNAAIPAPGSGFVGAGYTFSFGQGASDGYLLRTDASGISLSNLLYGNVHANLNANCSPISPGQGFPGYMIEVAGNHTYFGTTDAFGNYSVPVEEGTYNVRLINISPYWQPCADSINVNFVGTFDTVLVNYALTATVACPLMEVDISALRLRRCFENNYAVRYRNLGTETADPVTIEVNLDPYLNVINSSIPWVSNVGNTYIFNVGEVMPFESGEFQITVEVDCASTILGQTHCSEAYIFPDTLCLTPDPIWDGASIQLEAQCLGDSIEFTLKNIGDGDMTDPQALLVIEDVLLGYQGQYQLQSGADTTFVFLAEGHTLRMEADQSPGHPGNSKPSVAVEGCGGFTPGVVVQYPLNDADLSVDEDCRMNVGSYDPNDKMGFPFGYGYGNFIERGTDIEYLIRFQNTGTDTAFTVTIRDTLSSFLDVNSIQPGASSHPYRFDLYGPGILKFTFDNINLPDSTTNEPASHGFVKFRIGQRQNLEIGEEITNTAAIYFDYNAPIITNETLHTIGENFVEIGTSAAPESPGQPAPVLHVYPNPFGETAVFELENVQYQQLNFHLYDLAGKQVRQERMNGHKMEFHRNGLPGGVYFYKVEAEGKVISNGKIVLR